MNYFSQASELTNVSRSFLSLFSTWGQKEKKTLKSRAMIRETKWFWLSGTFPLSCPLSSYLQLLEVLLLHLLLCYNVRLVLNLVYLLRGAVCLNLRHDPGDRRLESRYHNLRGKLRCYLQLLASRQTFLSVGKPACQRATLLCLAGQSRLSAEKDGKSSRVEGDDRQAATRCDFD